MTAPVLDVQRARRAPDSLRVFNDAGVLAAADVHVATALGRLGGEDDGAVLLAAALAVRAPRLGHVCVDLTSVADTIAVDADAPLDPAALDWPDPTAWLEQVAASPLVAADGPLRLDGARLYLDRYWRHEHAVAADLRDRAGRTAAVDDPTLAVGLARLFPSRTDEPDDADLPRQAAETAVRRHLAVVAGGPGTGKTTTVARILALLDEQAAAAGRRPPLVALAAPTGKAAVRLTESVRGAAGTVAADPAVRARLAGLEAATLHRLLGQGQRGPGFRYGAGAPLPHDVVVVDELSMVSLALLSALLAAVRRDTRLVLLGDPDQLASVEAGAVLGDVVGPARERAGPLAGCITVLRRGHRFGAGSGIARLAASVKAGDADAALEVLAGADDVEWHPTDSAEPEQLPAPARDMVVAAARAVRAAAETGNAAAALAHLGALRVLCAHRRGPAGVAAWNPAVQRWSGGGDGWYPGRPVLVTANDYSLGLFNGDSGVTVRSAGRPVVAFDTATGIRTLSPLRLEAVETLFAMTVHRSQGSQFPAVVLALPDAGSRVLTRELLYTAVTRAQERLTVVGSEAALRAAIARRVQRASGLRDALWQ